jgi:hypothetical protein
MNFVDQTHTSILASKLAIMATKLDLDSYSATAGNQKEDGMLRLQNSPTGLPIPCSSRYHRMPITYMSYYYLLYINTLGESYTETFCKTTMSITHMD